MAAITQTSVPPQAQTGSTFRFLMVCAIALLLFYIAFTLYNFGQPLIGFMMLAVATAFAIIFGLQRYYNARFILPGIAAVAIFVAFPVIYTIYLGFTNYSSFNLLTQKRATEVLLSSTSIDPATERGFLLVPDNGKYRVYLPDDTGGFLSAPIALDGRTVSVAADTVTVAPAETLPMREAIKLRDGLAAIDITLPDGTVLKNSGLRKFAAITSEYELQGDGSLKALATGEILTPDPARGFFINSKGKTVPPGWRVGIGFDNFKRVFTQEGIRGPMLGIFGWTLFFALASAFLTFAVGLALAIILQWPHLKGKAIYRVLLILPYAVPSFISVLVFRGLFNQNFGEINMILEALAGIRPAWSTDPFLARSMILIVNVWLGYPYMMLLAMGFLQGIPEEHKKAASLEGASATRVFFSITLPQILPPFLPMIIATFAFNFNNIVLILLLTRGGPDIPGTLIPAGKTDILGSFTFRMAFMDTGQQFGLAGAITLLIFIVVAILAYANFAAMRSAAARRGARP
jgi:maltose/maltodextrin transport system permease protein